MDTRIRLYLLSHVHKYYHWLPITHFTDTTCYILYYTMSSVIFTFISPYGRPSLLSPYISELLNDDIERCYVQVRT